MIIATAGHVDHGKTTLVRTLTGVDTDRLKEEQRRGLTIEPGFAYLDMAGERWGFVDVPGHHRFVTNMLTGVAGVDAALLVVAADDGAMPQTHEHLAILELLGITQLVVAISKCDLVSAARLAEVDAELAELLAGFEQAPRIAVSAPTGRGLEQLREALGTLARRRQARAPSAPLRFAVDRAFKVRGVGLVVTGFVQSGTLAPGAVLDLLPAEREVRVRGLRAQDRPAQLGRTGERLALNLTGPGVAEVTRGTWLTTPGAVPAVQRLDVRLRCLPGVRLRSGTELHVHHGTARTPGRITYLDGPQATPRVHLFVRTPLAALHGDRLILRDASALHTLAGGRVLDHAPPRRGRRHPERLAELDALEQPEPTAILRALLALHPGELDASHWLRLLGAAPETAAALVPDALLERAAGGQLLLRDAHLFSAWMDKLIAALECCHREHPQLAGLGPDELSTLLTPRPPRRVLDALLTSALKDGRIKRSATCYHLPGHRVVLKETDAERWRQIRPKLAAPPVQPPVIHDLARMLKIAPPELAALLTRVYHTGAAVRIADNRFMLPEGLAILAHTAAACAASGDGCFELRDFRQAAGIGRNLAVDVLEYFDRRGLTRRRGNARLLVGSADLLFGSAPDT